LHHFVLPFTDPVLVFATVMLIVLVVPLIFKRLQIPPIIGLILTGVIVGPNLLGILQRGSTMVLLGTVGLLYIMFLAGLEIDLNEFGKSRDRSIVFGVLTFSIPQGLGTLMGVYLLGFTWPTSILLASMFASHTLLAYPTISRLGLAKNNAVTITVGGTIITDTAALLVLAVIAGSAQGELTAAFWIILSVSLFIYTMAVILGVPRISRWFFRYMSDGGVSEYIYVMAVVFIVAFMAEVAGVEAIVGAFLAGLTLNRLIPEHSTLMNRIEFIGNALFIPFFLISVGMLVDYRVLLTGIDAWVVAIAMVVTVTITKYAAALITQKLYGYTKEERGLIFGLSVPQAAATLAAVLIGFELGILNEAILNGTIVMILITCLIGSFVAERSARTMVLEAATEPKADEEEAPQRIMVPIANPATIDGLMDMAMMIRDSSYHQPVRAISVVSEDANLPDQVALNEKKLAPALERAAAADVPVRIVNRIDVSPARGILRAATEVRITHLIIGWNGRVTARERVFGSVLDQLLEQSHQLLLVCKLDHPLNTMERIILILPPNADHEPTFSSLIHTIKLLSQQIGTSMQVWYHDKNGDVERLVENIKPTVSAKYQTYENFLKLTDQSEKITDGDLLVVVSSRRDTISWQPALDRVPAQVGSRFQDHSFIIAYPALEVPRSMNVGRLLQLD
jgi:Kef-type K+ transport system membrane component KefB/nucleotide-binding universal stress UspA family protein